MQKIVIFILILCFALALYSYCFYPGQTLSFKAAYNNAMQLVKTVGGAFDSVKNTVTDGIKTVLGLPDAISNFFSNFVENLGNALSKMVERIRQFFAGLINRLYKLLKKETHCTCSYPEDCDDCKCEADDCPCDFGKGGSLGSR